MDMQAPPFPSLGHRTLLLRKSRGDRTTDDQWFIHAYDYGWRRVAIDDKVSPSPIDPERQWFDARLVDAAEAMWRKFFDRPVVREPVGPHSDEDIAAVERACTIIRANLEKFGRRSKAAFATKRDPIKRVRDELGVWVREQGW